MKSNFTPSINIERDSQRQFDYIPTPNALKLIGQIESDFSLGIRAFNLIGSYGTGKSSFLLALEQSLKGLAKHFNFTVLIDTNVNVINIVGEFNSFQNVFAEKLELLNSAASSESIFSELLKRSYSVKPNTLLLIVVDEFGKFLEFASQNQPEKELYFIQQLAEFVHSEASNIALITSIHQNFEAYSLSLPSSQKQEWKKVNGRFKELNFNEPVEQLLYLAAKQLPLNIGKIKNHLSFQILNSLYFKSKAFNISSTYIESIGKKLYPLEAFSASILALSLQRYGQNERSLFSFFSSIEQKELVQVGITKLNFFSTDKVYDYLIVNFYTFLNSKYNPDFNTWKSIQRALEKVESLFDKDITSKLKIIKIIGLLALFSSAGAILDLEFLQIYIDTSLGISTSLIEILQLQKLKIILFREYNSRFVIFEGTDLDFQSALIGAIGKVSDITDIPTLLQRHYQPTPILAKEVSYITGTPRIFKYVISEFPVNITPFGEIDGYINLIFDEKLSINEIMAVSASQNEAILYGYYNNSNTIKELLLEIEKTNYVIEDNIDDKIAVHELTNIINHQKSVLTHKILDNFHPINEEVTWIYNGYKIDIPSRKAFNKQLSEICRIVYYKTPVFHNELVNKSKISSSIHTAKKNYFKALVSSWDKVQLNFPENKFPPEKTIFLSMLEINGIFTNLTNSRTDFSPLSHNRFDMLWAASIAFLDSSKTSKKCLSDFGGFLSKRPFKLKRGLIDFWIPTFLFLKRDEFAIFSNSIFLPFINEEVLELISKNPAEYEIKSFNIEGLNLDIFNSYRNLLNKSIEKKLSNSMFIDTIRPFLIFYRDLPIYTKITQQLDRETLLIRDAISKSTDPEKIFFEDFPRALNYNFNKGPNFDTDLQNFALSLESSIQTLRNCYSDLIDRVEEFIKHEIIGLEIPFEKIRLNLQARYKGIRRNMLITKQKAFVQRLDSLLDDRNAWLNSLILTLLGKPLDKIQDHEELLIYINFREMIVSLDTLVDISSFDFKEDNELVLDLQISSFSDGVSRKLIRMPIIKQGQILEIEQLIKNALSTDKFLNIAALTNLLKEMIK